MQKKMRMNTEKVFVDVNFRGNIIYQFDTKIFKSSFIKIVDLHLNEKTKFLMKSDDNQTFF